MQAMTTQHSVESAMKPPADEVLHFLTEIAPEDLSNEGLPGPVRVRTMGDDTYELEFRRRDFDGFDMLDEIRLCLSDWLLEYLGEEVGLACWSRAYPRRGVIEIRMIDEDDVGPAIESSTLADVLDDDEAAE